MSQTQKIAVVALVGIVAVLIIAVCISSTRLFYTNQRQIEERKATVTARMHATETTQVQVTTTAQTRATATTQAQSTVTAQARAAATAQAQVTAQVRAAATARAQAIATTQARATATTQARATATAQAQATATAQVRATATAQARIAAAIARQMREASELITAIFTMQSVVQIEQENDPVIIIPVPPTELIYKAHGEIRAGFDLNEITASDVSVTGNEATIRLPPPVILVKSIDPDLSEVYHLDTPWFGTLEHETIERAQQEALKEIVDEACRQNILGKANQNAETAFEKLLSVLGFDEIHIVTQSSNICP